MNEEIIKALLHLHREAALKLEALLQSPEDTTLQKQYQVIKNKIEALSSI